MTSQDPSMETGFDPDMNRRRPQNPDRPLPTSRTSRGIDRSAFSIGKNSGFYPALYLIYCFLFTDLLLF